ncbi:unnamed protein product [Symbiodinium natans]|uniref:Uncharacterized protein n=1 Tax=Symbiodinium natans TaxID=878477 RepID=A0A812HJ57_9DINO|nr:unnamed protein product [Symbiodinium natans]
MASVALQIENQFSNPMVPRRLQETMPSGLSIQLSSDGYRCLRERVDKELFPIAEAAWGLSPLAFLLCGAQLFNVLVVALLVFLDIFFLDEVSLYVVEGILAVFGTSGVVLGLWRLHSRLRKAAKEAEAALREALAEESAKTPELTLQLSVQPQPWHLPIFGIMAVCEGAVANPPAPLSDVVLEVC